MMKILFVIDSLRAGGKERRLVQLLKGLNKKNEFKAELIILNKNVHYKEVFNLNIPIQYFKRSILQDIKLISRFNKICNNFKPDIVHCWDNIAAMQFAPICKWYGIKFVNSMITSAPKTKKLSKRYFSNVVSYPFSDVILSNSQASLDNLFVPLKKQKVIHNGYDFFRLSNIKPASVIREKYNIKNTFVIGMVASFSNFKDYDTFIQAALILNKKYDNISFVAVGDGINREKSEKTTTKSISDNFIFTGRIIDVESMVNIFNIGVLLTDINIEEGLSNSIMEYMALGKPVIATKGGGTSELVIDNETAFLIEPKNPEQVIEKIDYLISNPKIAKKMGQKGKEIIKKHFTLDKMVDKMYELYKDVLTS